MYLDNFLLLLSWIFPASVLTFTFGYRIFLLCGGWAHHEYNKFQHILAWRLPKIYIGIPFFNFKILIWPTLYKNSATGFHISWREAWPSCISFLPSDPFLIIFILFSLYESKIHFCFASSITFLSCLLHSGRSFRNPSTENLFLSFYAAWSNFASVASGLFFPVMQNHGPWLCGFL